MSFGDDDIDAFSGDMGVDVTFGGVTVQGLLDETDAAAVTADGQVEGVVHGTTLTLSAPARAQLDALGLDIDSILAVDGDRSFTVREFLRVDDGKFWHVMMAETTDSLRPVARLEVSPATFTIAVGGTQQLDITAYDADDNVLAGRIVTLDAADEGIATVDDTGLVTGVGAGECAIIARCEGVVSGAAATIAAEAEVASVEITPTDFSLNFGATQQLAAVAKDAQGNVLTGRTFTYRSTGATFVSVSASGLVTASTSNAGGAAIIVTCEGVSSAIAVTSVDPYAAFTAYDSVTRGDSSTSMGTATEKGGAWTVLLGTGGVKSNKLYAITGPMRAKLGTMPGGNGTVQADLSTADWTNNPPGLLFRMTDKDNNLTVTLTGVASGSIRYRIAGTLTAFATFNPGLTNGVAATVKVIALGATVIVLVNGVLKGSMTLTGSALTPSGTNAGCAVETASPATTTTIDNYQVTP